MSTIPYFAITFQKRLYWVILACYGLALVGLGLPFFIGLLGQVLLGILQIWINLVRGIITNHRPSLYYTTIAVLYMIFVAAVPFDFVLIDYQGITRPLLLVVVPILLATFAIFIIDPAYSQHTSASLADLLDDSL